MVNYKQRSRAKRGMYKASQTHPLVIQLAKELWKELGTPLCVGLYELAESGDWNQIIDFKLDPANYTDPAKFQKDYAAVNFIRKYPSLPICVDRKENAFKKFRESEIACQETNTRLLQYRRQLLKPKRAEVETVISRARSKIAWCLGSLNLNEVAEMMRWGPGVTSRTSYGYTSAYNKFDVRPECTFGCVHHAWAAINSSPRWGEWVNSDWIQNKVLSPHSFPLVRGNRVTTVPKDAKVDRIIAVEPHMNIFVQLGFGGVIRRRLKLVGVDLDDGQQENASLALEGASNGTFATVDLSSASDTISYEIVRLLLPEEWFFHLDAIRSHWYHLGDSKWHRYHKFSSMGNGFTFELESLIFWALSSSVIAESDVDDLRLCIYGDDIVLPIQAYPLLVDVLDFVGFTINKKKSFASGLFRESCGAHFFGKLDVKPVYVDKDLLTQVELNALHNQLVLLAERLVDPRSRWRVWSRVRKLITDFTPRRDRFFGPKGVGDGVLIGTFDESVPFIFRSRDGHQGYLVRSLVPVMKKQIAKDVPLLISKLYELNRRGSSTDYYLVNSQLSSRLPLREYAQRVRSSLESLQPFSQGEEVVIRGAIRQFRTRLVRCFRPEFVGVLA